jgi:hypothetical protein
MRQEAPIGGIDERVDLRPARTPLADFGGPGRDLRGLSRAGGALLHDLVGEFDNMVDGAPIGEVRHWTRRLT